MDVIIYEGIILKGINGAFHDGLVIVLSTITFSTW